MAEQANPDAFRRKIEQKEIDHVQRERLLGRAKSVLFEQNLTKPDHDTHH